MTDKQHLEAMLTALDASPRALERIGDWQIVGNNGHIMTDGRGFVFYVSTSESPRRWTGAPDRAPRAHLSDRVKSAERCCKKSEIAY